MNLSNPETHTAILYIIMNLSNLSNPETHSYTL